MSWEMMKTLSYGTMHFVVAISVAFALTGDWRIALSVGVIEPLVQTLAYTVHERAWKKRDTPRRDEIARVGAGSFRMESI